MAQQLHFTSVFDILNCEDMECPQQWQPSANSVSLYAIRAARAVAAFYAGLGLLDIDPRDPAVIALSHHTELLRKEYDKVVGIMLWERANPGCPSEVSSWPTADNDNDPLAE